MESARREKAVAEADAVNPSAAAAHAELLAVFARDAGKALQILESTAQNVRNLSADDMRLFTISVHGLKSALSNIGETALSQTALALEKAGERGDKGAIDAQLNNFINAISSVIVKAEAENSRARSLSPEDEDPKYLRERLTAIASACKDYDKDLIDETLKKLKKMSWTAATHETLDKIAALILNSDFSGAAEIAESSIPTS